jgi:hypothetical protein
LFGSSTTLNAKGDVALVGSSGSEDDDTAGATMVLLLDPINNFRMEDISELV